jgi:quinol-cytochrome oxidoreductase complex cytochrome b subunit
VGPWGFTAFSLLGLGLAVMPLFDRGPERQLRRRPVVAALGAVFFVGFLAAWLAGRQLRSTPPPAAVRPVVPTLAPTTAAPPVAPATSDAVPARDATP